MTRDLDVLTCTKCGAAIPFSDAATTTCPFCQTPNDVPAAYRDMRASTQLDAASRAEAERLLTKLDRPPLLVTKILARMFDFNFLVFLLAYGIPLTLWIVVGGMTIASRLAPHFGYPGPGEPPYWFQVACWFSIAFVVILVPRLLGIYANRRTTARVRLLAALAATPPKTEGGPALCRHCGAPLFVARGELLAVCAYCATQNAVELQTKLVAAAGQAAHAVAASVKDAAITDRKERHRTRKLLALDFVWYLLVFAFYDVAFTVGDKPGWGTLMIVLAALGLIALPFLSAIVHGYLAAEVADTPPGQPPDTRKPGGGKQAPAPRRAHQDAMDEAAARRAGNDVPGWVAAVGPIVVWYLFTHLPVGC